MELWVALVQGMPRAFSRCCQGAESPGWTPGLSNAGSKGTCQATKEGAKLTHMPCGSSTGTQAGMTRAISDSSPFFQGERDPHVWAMDFKWTHMTT